MNSLFQANVGNRNKDPKFIRQLTTAILETTLGIYYNYIFFRILINIIILLQVIMEKKIWWNFLESKDICELSLCYS